jgi:multiple sugar transport system substrate-binding protein
MTIFSLYKGFSINIRKLINCFLDKVLRMKKLILILVFPLILLANDKIVINYWTLFSGGDSRPMQFIVDKYNESQDKVIVNLKVILWAEYHKKLKENINKKDHIDLAIIQGSKLSEFIVENELTPLKEIGKKININWDEFTDDTKNLIEFKNNYYAIPIDTHLLLTYYNKAFLKKASLLDNKDNLKEPKNKEELIDFFKNLKASIPKGVVALGQPIDNVFPFWLWFSFYNQIQNNEGYIKDNKVLFNNPNGLKALELLTSLRDNEIYNEFITDNQAYNLFKYNKSAIFYTGVWSTWNYEQNDNLDFGVAPFPKVFDKRAMWSDSHTLVIPKSVTMEEKRIEILKFANFVADQGIEWSVAGHIPSKKKLLEDKNYKTNKLRYQYSKYLKYAIRMPKHPKLWSCNDKLIEIFANMMMSNKTAKDTLNLAAKECEKILNE